MQHPKATVQGLTTVKQVVGPYLSIKCTEDYKFCLLEKCIINKKSNYIGGDSKRKVYVFGDDRVGHCDKTSSCEHVSNSSYRDDLVLIEFQFNLIQYLNDNVTQK